MFWNYCAVSIINENFRIILGIDTKHKISEMNHGMIFAIIAPFISKSDSTLSFIIFLE